MLVREQHGRTAYRSVVVLYKAWGASFLRNTAVGHVRSAAANVRGPRSARVMGGHGSLIKEAGVQCSGVRTEWPMDGQAEPIAGQVLRGKERRLRIREAERDGLCACNLTPLCLAESPSAVPGRVKVDMGGWTCWTEGLRYSARKRAGRL